jgi:hypothetical protein
MIPMVPIRRDLIGRWSEDLGYQTELSRDTVIEFRGDGTGTIRSPDESIELLWEMPAAGRLVLVIYGNRLGPFAVSVDQKRLPLGEFTVLESESGLLPFDRRQFTRLQ